MNLLAFVSPLLSNWQRIAIYAALAAAFCITIWMHGYFKGESKYVEFKAQVVAAGKEAQKRKVEKEAHDAKQIKDALTERDAALAKLRRSANRRKLSDNSASPTAGSSVCIPTATYNAAMGEFSKRLSGFMEATRGYATTGDAAQIDAEALLRGWPSR